MVDSRPGRNGHGTEETARPEGIVHGSRDGKWEERVAEAKLECNYYQVLLVF